MPVPEVKFCGLMRAEDAAMAAELGAAFAGAIFAHGPRLLDAPRARAMFAGLGDAPVRRVGVFGAQEPSEILRIADAVRLDVLQLHDGATVSRVLTLRGGFTGAIWPVVKVAEGRMEPLDPQLAGVIDAVVLDTAVGGRSGGTGVAFDWRASRAEVAAVQRARPVVLAGGLTPSTVAEAVRVLAPWTVDVSSGVESTPGVKDHAKMQAFARAARLREE